MKHIVLLAGYPATGKTYMSQVIKQQHKTAMYISQDEIKELLYDKVGFNNLEQKEELVDFGRSIFYSIVKRSLEQNDLLLLDYPFSYKQVEFLNELKEEFEVDFLTICLSGDLNVLYDRRLERDLEGDRNKGHILSKYHGYESYTKETYPLTREEYIKNCLDGKYAEFKFGELLEVDVTIYDNIDYDMILNKVDDFLNGK